ncbi:unnamed protein product [Phytophthora lilii]|uniref:Unnamed protein product n=1 Tax=Phytophthora lilii TaxID=2077276 RepID=A0A9W6TSM6_9STRA|nr:unnamed protein product [Phytophthora lilii]
MRTGSVVSNIEMKESQVQFGEATSVSRPSVSASGSRGTFSCRRWRLLSGKPSKDGATLDARVATHQPSFAAINTRNVQRPTTAAVDSRDWASAATPFVAVLPRNTIVPTTSRKSVAAAVLTSAFPPDTATKWDREMTICDRKHVKAMGRMASRIYSGKSVGEDHSEPARMQKNREKQALKDQIYLPVLCKTRAGGLRELSPHRPSKFVQPSPREAEADQKSATTMALPDALAGIKLLSSQLEELRAGLDITSIAHDALGRTERLWYPLPQRTKMAFTRQTQTSQTPGVQPMETGSSSSSLETLLLRVLERPAACPDGYQADQEESTLGSSNGISGSTYDSEDDLLLLLSALDSTTQTSSSEDETSNSVTSNSLQPASVTTSDLTVSCEES